MATHKDTGPTPSAQDKPGQLELTTPASEQILLGKQHSTETVQKLLEQMTQKKEKSEWKKCLDNLALWMQSLPPSELGATTDQNKPRLEHKPPLELVTTAKAQVPFWRDEVQPVPNMLFCAAFLSVMKNGRGGVLSYQKLDALEGVEARCTGAQLGLGHFMAWCSIARALRGKEYNRTHLLSSYQLLKILGLTINGKNRAILEKYILELASTVLTIRVAPKGKRSGFCFSGSLLAFAAKEEKSGKWAIGLGPNLARLFSAGHFSELHWELLCAFKGQPMAQWLFIFYFTHAKPYAYSMKRLLELMGSQNSHTSDGKRTLREALAVVAQLCKEYGVDFSYEIIDDLVHVRKSPRTRKAAPLRKRAV